MLALTLWQPWATIVAAGHKLIENRRWAPPSTLIGQRFAIHAGQVYDREAVQWINDRLLAGRPGEEDYVCPVKPVAPAGAVVGVATLEGFTYSAADLRPELAKWFIGPVGWILRDVVSIDPVPCRGAQKLWTMPEAIAREVTRRAAAQAALPGEAR